MTTSFTAPDFLRWVGPFGFTRQMERLALHLGFTDVVNIDGANDQGGDILATREGRCGCSRRSGRRERLCLPVPSTRS